MAISSYYPLTPIDVAKTLACIGVDYAAFCYSTMTDSLCRLGDAGRSVANRCTNILNRCTSKPKQKVPNLSYPAFYLNSGLKRIIGEIQGRSKSSFPGIIQYQHSGLECDLCTDHASYHANTSISLYNSVEWLKKEGYQATAIPQKGDLIFYFSPDEDEQRFSHVGVVSQVENGVVWIKSKWGKMPVYEHLEEAVPEVYGNAVVYLHKRTTRWV